ncbi:hypothetical protein VTK26DRAFT_7537 [Humicola hyalothermophila]
MPSTPTKTSGADENFTASEIKFIIAMLSNLNSKIDVNWDGLAHSMGVKKKSVTERWRVMRNKFNIPLNGADDDGSPSTSAAAATASATTRKTRTPASRKRGAAAAAGAGGGASEEGTPTKRARKAAKTPAVAADDDGDDGDHGYADEEGVAGAIGNYDDGAAFYEGDA